MGRLDRFKTSINSTLDRKYLLEKWIGDDSLVAIIKENYALDFINKDVLIGIFLNFNASRELFWHLKVLQE